MKKLITCLSSLTISGTAVLTVVSCTPSTSSVKIEFKDIDKKMTQADYQILKAENGNLTSDPWEEEWDKVKDNEEKLNEDYFKSINFGKQFSSINQFLSNLILFNVNSLSDAEKLNQENDFYKGYYNDVVKEGQANNNLTVHGQVKNHNNKNVDLNELYKQYDNTHIASLLGMYDLYNFVSPNNTKDKARYDNLGKGAKESYDVMEEVMQNPTGSEFMTEFTSSGSRNPGFTKIQFDFDTTQYESKISKPEQIEKIINDEGTITDISKEFYSDETNYPNDFKETKVIVGTEQFVKPLSAKIINIDNKNLQQELGEIKIKDVTEEIKDDKDNKKWKDIKNNDLKTENQISVVLDDNIIDKQTYGKKIKDNTIGSASKDIALNDFKFVMTYTTDRFINNSDPVQGAKEYKLEFSINGLHAKFVPVIRERILKKEEKDKESKKYKEYFVGWQFVGYSLEEHIKPVDRVPADNKKIGKLSGVSINKLSVTKNTDN